MEYALENKFIDVGGTPSFISKCGKIENDVLILIIPGNPGVATYYDDFIKVLHEKSGLAVWSTSHAGHVTLPANLPHQPNADASRKYVSLAGQIEHKLDFIKEHVAPSVRLVLIGHSIGCYIILHMLKALPPERVIKCALLFPTIERMAVSDSGKYAAPFLKYMRWAAPWSILPATFLSKSAQRSVLEWYFRDCDVSECAIDATLKLVSWQSLDNIVNMANEEMQSVVNPDYDVIDAHLDKLWFYYGSKDHWCPVAYYEDMKSKYPSADIMLCRDGIQHAFCLDAGSSMAVHVFQWLSKFVPTNNDSIP